MKECNEKTNIRIVEIDGNFQPQIYKYVKVPFWQPIRKEWVALVYNDKYWYDNKEDAIKQLDKVFNSKEPEQNITYYQ